jgi:NAD(P)H-hydrate epimerase
MENAGREVAKAAETFFGKQKKSWLVLAGKGNNGGDALVAARHLTEWGHRTEIVFAENPNKLRGDAAVQCRIANNLGIPMLEYGEQGIKWSEFDGIIDGLLGTGTSGPPREPYAALIREANSAGVPIVSIDIPSGLNADTGTVYEPCIGAAVTVTLAFLKRGLVQYPGKAVSGEVQIAPIGIPEAFADKHGVKTYLITERVLSERLGAKWTIPREADSHKGTYGHVLVAAGSRKMSGAGLLCTAAALRSGCGLATWAVPDKLADAVTGCVPEAMLAPVEDGGTGDWTTIPAQEVLSLAVGKDAVAAGPGMGRFPDGEKWVQALWEGVQGSLLLDADALNMMAEADYEKWPRRKAPTVLTPHPGEFARLLKRPVQEIQADRIGAASELAERLGVTLVLKGAQTVIATPEGAAFVNTTGNPGMATGGTGDVLAGMIAGLLAQGYDGPQAACLGVYLHGRAGDEAAARLGQSALIAGDLLDRLTRPVPRL